MSRVKMRELLTFLTDEEKELRFTELSNETKNKVILTLYKFILNEEKPVQDMLDDAIYSLGALMIQEDVQEFIYSFDFNGTKENVKTEVFSVMASKNLSGKDRLVFNEGMNIAAELAENKDVIAGEKYTTLLTDSDTVLKLTEKLLEVFNKGNSYDVAFVVANLVLYFDYVSRGDIKNVKKEYKGIKFRDKFCEELYIDVVSYEKVLKKDYRNKL